MYSPVSACQVAGCLKNLVCVLNICVQYTCIMFEAAWVSVVLVPLLVRKSRWSQEWCSGVYRQNHCRDKTNFQRRHQVRHLETASAGMGVIWFDSLIHCKWRLLAWSWDVCQTPEQPGRRKKHTTLRGIWPSMSLTNAVKHILLQPRWRTHEDSWGLWCIASLSLFALQVYFTRNSHSWRCFDILRLSLSVWSCKFISPSSFLLPKVKADTVQAAVAEAEEAADCEQCLQKETQRQEESESRLQMLGLFGGEVLSG